MDTHHSVKVLYIIGSGRSGSTILDAVLGNHDEIFSTGELKKLWRRYEEHYCSCGEDRRQCLFWESVRNEWEKRAGENDIEKQLTPLTDLFERFRRWRRLIGEQAKKSADFQKYARFNTAVFETVKHISGKSIIIDSSKVPERAFALSLIPGVDLYFIHLIRDGRGVIWSRKKQVDSKAHPYAHANTSFETTLKWIKSNLVSEYVLKKSRAPYIRLRYEDFVENPYDALREIGRMIKVDMSTVEEKLRNKNIIVPPHMIGGNRVRFERSFRLTIDRQWEKNLGLMDKLIFFMFAAPLAKRYKYKMI